MKNPMQGSARAPAPWLSHLAAWIKRLVRRVCDCQFGAYSPDGRHCTACRDLGCNPGNLHQFAETAARAYLDSGGDHQSFVSELDELTSLMGRFRSEAHPLCDREHLLECLALFAARFARYWRSDDPEEQRHRGHVMYTLVMEAAGPSGFGFFFKQVPYEHELIELSRAGESREIRILLNQIVDLDVVRRNTAGEQPILEAASHGCICALADLLHSRRGEMQQLAYESGILRDDEEYEAVINFLVPELRRRLTKASRCHFDDPEWLNEQLRELVGDYARLRRIPSRRKRLMIRTAQIFRKIMRRERA